MRGRMPSAIKVPTFHYARELAYIESGGTQYINTGVEAKASVRLLFTVQSVSFGGDDVFCGSYGGSSASEMVAFYAYNNKYYFKRGGSYFNSISTDTNVHTIDFRQGYVTYDGVTYTLGGSGSSAYPYYLFASSNKGNPYVYSRTRLYSFKAFDGDVLIRDFIPVLDLDGVACLFDKVEKKLYYNAGSGTFGYAEVA